MGGPGSPIIGRHQIDCERLREDSASQVCVCACGRQKVYSGHMAAGPRETVWWRSRPLIIGTQPLIVQPCTAKTKNPAGASPPPNKAGPPHEEGRGFFITKPNGLRALGKACSDKVILR